MSSDCPPVLNKSNVGVQAILAVKLSRFRSCRTRDLPTVVPLFLERDFTVSSTPALDFFYFPHLKLSRGVWLTSCFPYDGDPSVLRDDRNV